MGRVAVEIPRIGLVMENTRLVRWLKNVGDIVRQGEPLLELETEKSLVEIESTESGRLVEILLNVDQVVRVGDRVAWLESDVSEAASTMPLPSRPKTGEGPFPVRVAGPSAIAPQSPPCGEQRVRSSPAARHLAAQHDVNLSGIAATGPRGRVQLEDVRRALQIAAPSQSVTAPHSAARPISGMRRALARAMTLSNATVPQFVVERAVDWTALRSHRAQLIAGLPADAPRPSVNDFLLQAVARTLLAFPALNAIFTGDPDSPNAAIVPSTGTHIGLVVAVEDGLFVPVFHGAEQLDVVELARRRRDTVERALRGSLKREDLEGATISISNLGARGPDRFVAIINPPQSAILAVGRERDSVVALDSGIQVRPVSELALTVDHRVADGRLASDFLADLVSRLSGAEPRTG
jgi:pyruvate dehydrogenase E2 component (dihydrolipoamide acetyltransferase)